MTTPAPNPAPLAASGDPCTAGELPNGAYCAFMGMYLQKRTDDTAGLLRFRFVSDGTAEKAGVMNTSTDYDLSVGAERVVTPVGMPPVWRRYAEEKAARHGISLEEV